MAIQQLIDQQKTPKNGAISEDTFYCLHGYVLNPAEQAAGLGLARSACPFCGRAPSATDKIALQRFLNENFMDELNRWDENLAEDEETRPEWKNVQADENGIHVTRNSTQRASTGRGTRIGRPGDWGPALKYEPPKKIQQSDDAAVTEEHMGGRKVKPKGRGPDSDE